MWLKRNKNGGLETMTGLELLFTLLIIAFILETSAFIYFARWILWRINPKLTILMTDFYKRTENDEDE